jgi:outer membrane protein OmpA-like peptidoglycan-associated protein
MRTDRGTKCLSTLILAGLALACPALAQRPEGAASPYPISQPQGTWQTPGAIQQPKGSWQMPGAIQVPKGIQAVRSDDKPCERRVSVVTDALFNFDKSDLRTDAVETLAAVGPEIAKAGQHPVIVEGFTDAIGTDTYNLKLSEQRARAVRDWLARQGFIPIDTAIKGYGKQKPLAPNQTPDGRDNPEGRQKNRRVEIAINTCG